MKNWEIVKTEVENPRRAQLSSTVTGSGGSSAPMEVDSLVRQVNALSSRLAKVKGKSEGRTGKTKGKGKENWDDNKSILSRLCTEKPTYKTNEFRQFDLEEFCNTPVEVYQLDVRMFMDESVEFLNKFLKEKNEDNRPSFSRIVVKTIMNNKILQELYETLRKPPYSMTDKQFTRKVQIHQDIFDTTVDENFKNEDAWLARARLDFFSHKAHVDKLAGRDFI